MTLENTTDKTIKVIPHSEYPENDLYNIFLNNTRGDIHKWHHYFTIYDRHFKRYQNKPVNVLEIGVFRGGSLRMWKDYFGEQATIFGVDIDENCKKFETPEKNIFVHIGDQSNSEFLCDLMAKLPKIDILIDDGGHTTNQQITTFLHCYDKIADDGVYLCEDLHTNYWNGYIDSSETFMDFAKRHTDYLNSWFTTDFEEKLLSANTTEIPLFTGITHSISFYNSIVVFEKEKVKRPFAEIR